MINGGSSSNHSFLQKMVVMMNVFDEIAKERVIRTVASCSGNFYINMQFFLDFLLVHEFLLKRQSFFMIHTLCFLFLFNEFLLKRQRFSVHKLSGFEIRCGFCRFELKS